jgi:hypothetical protein
MHVARCKRCGKREIDPKYLNSRLYLGTASPTGKTRYYYCSEYCYTIENAGENLVFSIFMFFLGFIVIPFWAFYLNLALKGFKHRRELGNWKEKQPDYCFHCQAEITETPKGKGVCMSCGEIIHFCDICQEHIFHGDTILQLEPCGHIFHKNELLDWIDSNNICPKCAVEVEFVDVKPE